VQIEFRDNYQAYVGQISALYPDLDWEVVMRRLCTHGWWFDHVSLQALARALEIDINIISSAGQDHDSEAPATQLDVPRAFVFLGHLVGRHYVALVPGKEQLLFTLFLSSPHIITVSCCGKK
jgi:hypothetical protein